MTEYLLAECKQILGSTRVGSRSGQSAQFSQITASN